MLNDQVIRVELWTIAAIAKIEVLKWLARRHLIANSITCEDCQRPCSINKYDQGIDGYHWYCCQCKHQKSVRQGSLLERSKLSLHNLVLLIQDFPQKVLQLECIPPAKMAPLLTGPISAMKCVSRKSWTILLKLVEWILMAINL